MFCRACWRLHSRVKVCPHQVSWTYISNRRGSVAGLYVQRGVLFDCGLKPHTVCLLRPIHQKGIASAGRGSELGGLGQ